jgi:hypothetical protein
LCSAAMFLIDLGDPMPSLVAHLERGNAPVLKSSDDSARASGIGDHGIGKFGPDQQSGNAIVDRRSRAIRDLRQTLFGDVERIIDPVDLSLGRSLDPLGLLKRRWARRKLTRWGVVPANGEIAGIGAAVLPDTGPDFLLTTRGP